MSEWSPLERAGVPLAPHVGPFPTAEFVEVWWRHHGAGIPIVVEAARSALACVVDGGVVRLAGDADLTDYHSPLGSAVPDLVEGMASAVGDGARLVFDSLPREASEPLAAALADAGVDVTTADHAVTMVVDLPTAVDEYLAGLDGKHRHEIRRKRRRFEDAFGAPGLRRDDAGFRAFVDMHRAAPGDKGTFMSDAMEAFFRDLLVAPGWSVDILVGSAGVPIAAAFGYEDVDGYYLYNLSFDPVASAASPGIILCDELIRAAITSGRRRFDFLKGREGYKRRFGATPRPLVVLEGLIP